MSFSYVGPRSIYPMNYRFCPTCREWKTNKGALLKPFKCASCRNTLKPESLQDETRGL